MPAGRGLQEGWERRSSSSQSDRGPRARCGEVRAERGAQEDATPVRPGVHRASPTQPPMGAGEEDARRTAGRGLSGWRSHD